MLVMEQGNAEDIRDISLSDVFALFLAIYKIFWFDG